MPAARPVRFMVKVPFGVVPQVGTPKPTGVSAGMLQRGDRKIVSAGGLFQLMLVLSAQVSRGGEVLWTWCGVLSGVGILPLARFARLKKGPVPSSSSCLSSICRAVLI